MRILSKIPKKKGMVIVLSINRKTIIILTILMIVLIVAGLIIYSIVSAHNYDGIFVNGVKQVFL